MWQIFLAAAVAGSGIFASRLCNASPDSTTNADSDQTQKCEGELRSIKSANPFASTPSNIGEFSDLSSEKQSPTTGEDAIFRFSSQGSLNRDIDRSEGKKVRGRKGNVKGIKKGFEVQRLEKKFSVFLKRRRTGKNSSTKCGSSSSKDSSIFGWGLGVGIMYMMSAGKDEISKLNAAVDETAKVVQELNSAIYKRKPLCNMQVSSSLKKFKDADSKKIGAKHIQLAVTKSISENKDRNDMKDFVLPVIDDHEYASSVLTEEPQPEILEMDQLEAELEFELQKLPGCITEDCGHERMKSLGSGEPEVLPKFYHEPEGESSSSYQFNGVLPSELDKKLCHLLIEQQETQIVELESELHVAQSKLHEKEAELQSLKDCVRRLTEFSLLNVSDEEADPNVEQERASDMDFNHKNEPDSKKSVVGMKRAIDFESCDYPVR